MTRLNIVLTLLVVVCALGLVQSQHQARKLYFAHEKVQVQARELEVNYKQLELEQSALAKTSLIDARARKAVSLQPPASSRVLHVLGQDNTQASLAPTPGR
jgi:cell division protein FtsL